MADNWTSSGGPSNEGQTDKERGTVPGFSYDGGSRNTGKVGSETSKPNEPVEIQTANKGARK